MSQFAMPTRATVIPCLTYRDAKTAIRWLCDTFGFERHAVYEGPNDTIMHAELAFGNGMIMLGSAEKDSDYGKLTAQPEEIGGRQTQTLCVVTKDPDELYRRVKTAGVEILRDIRDESYGGRDFICRDLEGHVWCFGSYDPWKDADGAKSKDEEAEQSTTAA
jgi:uncharacterized glyoxalase superfamily protein PhnB